MSLTLGRRINDPYVPDTIENLLSLGKIADSVFVEINSHLADEILVKCNTKNRPVSKANVQKLAKQMESGKWINGTGHIMFNDAGRFIDGQHRLSAISQTGIPAVFCVNFNVPDQAFAVLDTNKKRSASDTLAVHGHKNLATLSSMIRKINHYYNAKGNMWNINTPCDNETTLQIANANNHYTQIAAMIDSNKDFSIYGNKSDIATCYGIFANLDKDLADAFMKILISNDSDYQGKSYNNLFGSLRKELTRNRNTAHKIHAGKKTDPHEAESRTYWYMFDGWNAFRVAENREISKKVSRSSFPLLQAHK
jgi:hypothetical protein